MLKSFLFVVIFMSGKFMLFMALQMAFLLSVGKIGFPNIGG